MTYTTIVVSAFLSGEGQRKKVAYFERLDRRRIRDRLRIRTYGSAGESQPVFLENKRKSGRWVVKHRVCVADTTRWFRVNDARPWRFFCDRLGGREAYAAHSFLQLVDGGQRSPITAVHYEREVFVDRRSDRRRAASARGHFLEDKCQVAPVQQMSPPATPLLLLELGSKVQEEQQLLVGHIIECQQRPALQPWIGFHCLFPLRRHGARIHSLQSIATRLPPQPNSRQPVTGRP